MIDFGGVFIGLCKVLLVCRERASFLQFYKHRPRHIDSMSVGKANHTMSLVL